MTQDDRTRAGADDRGLKDIVREVAEQVTEMLEELFRPPPELIPVRVRRPQAPRRPRRR